MMELLALAFFTLLTVSNAYSLGIPTFPYATNDGHLDLSTIKRIIVDPRYPGAVDERGQTLIPPTLLEFAGTFANDLQAAGLPVAFEIGDEASADAIFLTLGTPSAFLDVAGRESSEGYSLAVSAKGITITGASPLGVWWGTRTVLQQAVLSNGTIPYGSGTDTPGWGTRGMMLDVGRHYYPPEFLVEMCAYMSFFKQNTFQIHLSDNLNINDQLYTRERSLELYARFRLWSEDEAVAGLNKHRNESYTREQFDHIQSSCAARGITIIPEIEAPGHALVFVQWKPELGLTNDLSLLNISHPDTIPMMKTTWDTFLPWFHTKTVHIGADEYTAEVNDYNIFVNAMADHITTVSNKSIRIWGTFPPVYKEPGYINIYKNVSIQHWEFFEDNPLHDYILNNYTVLNSDDTFYVVNKWSGSYPQSVNISRTFNGNPKTGGGLWYPNIFDRTNSSNNPKRDEPLVLGEIAPLWNDFGPNSSVYSEAYYAWREGIPALADKQWGGNLTAKQFLPVLEALHPHIPAQNLERRIPSKGETILEYSFDSYKSESNSSTKVPDNSGNGYLGSTDCDRTRDGAIIDSCSITTPLSSKGRDYTLTLLFSVHKLSNPTNATLITGGDSALMLTPNITFFAGGEYFRLNTSLPLNQKLDLNIIGRGNQTFARIGKRKEEGFVTKIGVLGERFEWGPMAFEAPLREIGGKDAGWKGEVFGLKLTDFA